jgi:peptidoglycan hydrolase-like protein with peptidoglycan-binding domain
MNRSALRLLAFSFTVVFVASGCATTRARKADPAQDPQQQVADLQNQLIAKDQEIADLKYQLDSSRQALPATNFSAANVDKQNMLRVAGVSGSELQRALLRAGYDPGPIDGKLGKKTRTAVKAFQRKNGLTADGVVGEKTWSMLRSY